LNLFVAHIGVLTQIKNMFVYGALLRKPTSYIFAELQIRERETMQRKGALKDD